VPIVTSALTARLVAGGFESPKEGESFEWPGGQPRTWTRLTANEDGAFASRAFRGGFAFASIASDRERVMMLEAAGHSYVYVNGEPRAGDPYSYGTVRTPVLLRQGENALLFNVGRGSLRAKLVEPEGEVFVEGRDATLPDIVLGESSELWAGLIVTNATTRLCESAKVTATIDGGEPVTTTLPDLPPLASMKVPVRFTSPTFKTPGKTNLTVRLEQWVDRRQVVATRQFPIEVKPLHDLHKRTFLSDIDGSVQYYAVRPPFQANLATADALVLTVHGAGVEATGQAAAYGAKSWAWIVAATNRRPYGFDWEDWGRLDALEVLADAKARYTPREDRIYLTGHSMGGHGTWYLGATHPDQWGAIGPAAGWISFWTYGGAVRYEDPDPIEALLLRAANPSDTTKLLRNYLGLGVFVLHGDADQTVQVSQARQMRELLGAIHRDVDWHEEPGGGHWYDNTPEPGADCVDFGPMFEFFDRRRRRLSHEVRRVEFHTSSPQVSATSHWVTIARQTVALAPSSVVAVNPIGTQRVEVQTSNVAFLGLDVSRSPLPDRTAPLDILIDGSELKDAEPMDGTVWLEKVGSDWVLRGSLSEQDKTPRRGGPFRAAFDNRFVLVYGTTGTPEENAWSYAKARYDAETWWYRGNGTATLVADTQFRSDEELGAIVGLSRRTNAIVYGNEDTNLLAKRLLADSPVRLARGVAQIGSHELRGDDLSMLVVRPARGRLQAAVEQFAVVGGTGLKGMRSTDTLPYFVSGVHYPDVYVFDSRIHTIGSKAVITAGYFGNDWSVERGEIVWREGAR
jgi:poly(3-hydroxybutyrate) depolymerase